MSEPFKSKEPLFTKAPFNSILWLAAKAAMLTEAEELIVNAFKVIVSAETLLPISKLPDVPAPTSRALIEIVVSRVTVCPS